MTEIAPRRPLRLWAGVAIVVLQLIALYVPAYLAPGTPAMFFGMMGSFTVGTLLLFIWWLFFSRARWIDRIGGLLLLVVVHGAAFFLADESAKMVAMVPGIPWLCAAFVASLLVGDDGLTGLEPSPETITLAVSGLVAWKWRRTGLTMVIGMATLWLLQWIWP